MKRFTYLILFILAIFIIFFAIKFDYVKRSDFPGKKIVKNSFYYMKKNYLINKYSNCFIDEKNKKIDKKIMVAGHTYGWPEDQNPSTYPKFLNHLSNKLEKRYDYLFLAGDIVRKSNKNNFFQVKNELSYFFNNLLVAPGNHDVGLALADEKKRNEFLSVFNKNYQKTVINENLFFVLDSTLDPGNISEDQLIFLESELKKIKNIKNIFVITHHVIWQNYTKKKLMSNANKEFFSNNNFKELISLFDNLDSKIKIFFIAGDVGVLKERTALFCEKKMNSYFIATGMGSKVLDNYLKILINSNGEIVSIKPIFY